ncbi:low temperature requirement protein A [Plantactinospora sp. KLBMP9567]|uniref:low temperature requirement protein A n=1 Tax=Plantactinospora sp. KLBMP9567 TaxID=3085900 RepID=UPI003990A288
MATGRRATLIRDPSQPQRATPVELFYDLVFVFMLARLAEALLMNLHPRGAYQTFLLLLAIWWVWSYTNLTTDTLDSPYNW